MIIFLSKFGELLSSRPAGREAYFSAKAYLLPKNLKKIEFDFKDVKVLTPSWLDEFLILLKTDFPKVKLSFQKSTNPTVISTLKILQLDKKINL